MTNEPRITPIPRDILPEMWVHAVPHLLKGLTRATDLTLKQIATDLIKGDDRLWCIFVEDEVVAAFLTATFIDDETGVRFLGVHGLGGQRVDLWGEALGEKMIEAARSAGCASVRFVGRDAWSRVLPTYQQIGRMAHEAVYERAAR